MTAQNNKTKPTAKDTRGDEVRQETIPLLKLLAIGDREIEQGKFRNAEDVFAEMDNRGH